MPHRRALLLTPSLLLVLVLMVPPLLSAQIAPAAVGGLDITPDGGAPVQILQGSSTTVTFWAQNSLTTSGSWSFACSRTGGVTCGSVVPASATIAAGGGREVDVTLSATAAGTARITLTASPGGETGFVDVMVQALGAPVVALRHHNRDNVDRSLCLTAGAGESAAWGCGDLVITHSMPGFSTMGRERSLTLIHNSATAYPRPAIAAVVTQPSGVSAPTAVFAELKVGSTIRNSAAYTGWSSSSSPSRQIVLDFNGASDPTGAYPIELRVQNQYAGSVHETLIRDTVLIVNRFVDQYGAGFSLAGLERLFFNQPVGTTLGHIFWMGGDGSAKLYRKLTATTWEGPPGAFQDTIRLNSGVYTRYPRHGVQVRFNSAGRHTSTINRTGQVTTFTYNAAGDRLIDIQVPPACGATCTYTLAYDANNNLDYIMDPGGRKLDATFNFNDGRLSSLTDPDGKTVVFGWDGDRRIISRTNRRGFTTTYEYSLGRAVGSRITKVTVPVGRSAGDNATAVTTFAPWNDKGLALAATGQVAVDTSQATTLISGPRPGVADNATFWVDRWGAPTKVVDAIGATTTLVRNNSTFPALVTRVTHPNGRITDQIYGDRGHLKKIRDDIAPAAGDPPTRVTEYFFPTSGMHRDSPIEVRDSINGKARRTRYAYNPLIGLTDTVVDPRGHRTTFKYKTDPVYQGLLIQVTEHGVETWQNPPPDTTDLSFALRDLVNRFDYDSKGNLRADTSTVGAATSYMRDGMGRVTIHHDPLKTRTERTYDPMNRVTTVKQHLLPQAGMIAAPLGVCDATQAVCSDDTQQDAALPISVTTTYKYGSMGLDSVRDARGVTRAFEYDARELLERETDDYLKVRHAFYGPGGTLDSSLSRTGRTVRYDYDAAGRDTSMRYPAILDQVPGSTKDVPGDTVRKTYDVMGNLKTVINREGTITRDYYRNGLLKRKIMAFTAGALRDTISYVYNAAGAVRKKTHGADSTKYCYTDETGVLDSMVIHLGAGANLRKTFKFQWDALGRRRRITYPTDSLKPMTVEFRYDAAGILRRLVSKHPTSHPVSSTPDLFTFRYRNLLVNPIGRILKDSLTCSASNGLGNPCGDRNTVFIANSYNRQGALTRQIKRIGTTGSTTYKDTTRYDASGNILYQAKQELGEIHVYTINGPHNRMAFFQRTELSGSLKRLVYNDDGARHREYRDPALSSAPEDRYYYYDGLGRMTGTREWIDPADPKLSDREGACQYDGDGQMVGPCDNGSPKLSFDGNNTSGTMTGWYFFHGPGLDDPLMGYYRGTSGPRLFFWVTDGQGREFAVADSFATRQSTDGGGDIGAWRYAGGTQSGGSFEADRFASTSSPKLSFFRNRAYDQETGRWTQEDPIGLAGGLNLYQFNGNNPVSYTDPFGLCPQRPCIPLPGVAEGSRLNLGQHQTLSDESRKPMHKLVASVGASITMVGFTLSSQGTSPTGTTSIETTAIGGTLDVNLDANNVKPGPRFTLQKGMISVSFGEGHVGIHVGLQIGLRWVGVSLPVGTVTEDRPAPTGVEPAARDATGTCVNQPGCGS